MRRLLLTLSTLLMPLIAAGQSLGGNPQDMASSLLQRPPDQVAAVQPGVVVPLWRGADGHMLALQLNNATPTEAQGNTPLSFRAVDASSVMSSSLQYNLAPHLSANAGVTQRSWVNSAQQVVGSEVGATYNGGPYSFGLSLGSDSAQNSATATLPRVLPGIVPGVNGLSGFDNSTQLNANGRLALGNHSGIDIGASVGRIRLLPGNLLGLSTVDQKAVSFGIDHGAISGNIIGRTMEPEVGAPGSFGPADNRHWNSIDLGVTWHLPWQGSLSFGAQNVWSSGNSMNTPVGPEPDQSRTPYVQYHQDL